MPEVTDPALLSALNGGQSGPQPIVIGRPNPNKQRRDQIDVNDAAYQLGRRPIDDARKDREAQSKAIQDQIAIEKATLELETARKASVTGGLSAEDANTYRQKLGNLQALENQINTVQSLFDQSQRGGGASSIAEYLPSQDNSQFDAASAGLAEMGLSAFRVPGVGAQSDLEARQFSEANKPSSWSFDSANLQRLDNIRNRVNQTRAQLGLPPAKWDGRQDDQQAVGLGGGNPPAGGPGGGPDGGGIQSFTPADIGPSTPGQLAPEFNNKGYSPEAQKAFTSFLRSVPRGQLTVEALTNFRRQLDEQEGFGQFSPNPDEIRSYVDRFNDPKRKYNDTLPSIKVPASRNEQLLDQLKAFGLSAGNAASLGLPSLFGGQETRDKLDAARNDFPGTSIVGDIAGGVGGAVGVGLLGRKASTFLGGKAATAAASPLTANTAYGSLTGFNNADEGQGLQGAALGGAAGAIGDRIGAGIGKALSPNVAPALQRLRDAGVPMTIGQIGRGKGGLLGRLAAGTEDVLANTPGVSALVNPRRADSLDAFNRAAFNEGVAPIGGQIDQAGAQGIQQMRAATNQAYADALDPVNVLPDQQFAQGLQQAAQRGAAIPGEMGQGFQHFVENTLTPIARNGSGPEMSGKQFQDMLRAIRSKRSSYSNTASTGSNPLGDDVANSLSDMESELVGLIGRQSPETMPAFNAANQAYRNRKILESAVGSAKNQLDEGAEIFTPAQLNTASFGNAKKYGGQTAAAAGERPFYDLATAGQEILPNKVPPTGVNAAPMLALGGLGAGAAGFPAIATGAAAALPYTKLGQKAVQYLMIGDRPVPVKAAGEFLKRRGGLLGAAALVPYAGQ